MIRPKDINRAYERVVNKDVRYRIVIDMVSMATGQNRRMSPSSYKRTGFINSKPETYMSKVWVYNRCGQRHRRWNR